MQPAFSSAWVGKVTDLRFELHNPESTYQYTPYFMLISIIDTNDSQLAQSFFVPPVEYLNANETRTFRYRFKEILKPPFKIDVQFLSKDEYEDRKR